MIANRSAIDLKLSRCYRLLRGGGMQERIKARTIVAEAYSRLMGMERQVALQLVAVTVVLCVLAVLATLSVRLTHSFGLSYFGMPLALLIWAYCHCSVAAAALVSDPDRPNASGAIWSAIWHAMLWWVMLLSPVVPIAAAWLLDHRGTHLAISGLLTFLLLPFALWLAIRYSLIAVVAQAGEGGNRFAKSWRHTHRRSWLIIKIATMTWLPGYLLSSAIALGLRLAENPGYFDLSDSEQSPVEAAINEAAEASLIMLVLRRTLAGGVEVATIALVSYALVALYRTTATTGAAPRSIPGGPAA